MQVALDHAPMHCTAFHRQLLLHLSYNWPMEKKNSPARCFVQFPIAIFQIFGCKMWPQHARFVFWMSTNIHPSVTASVQKLAQSRLRLSFCVFVFSPIFQKTEAPQCSRNKYLAERVSFLTFSVSLCLARSQNQLWHIPIRSTFYTILLTSLHILSNNARDISAIFSIFFTFFQYFTVFLTFLSDKSVLWARLPATIRSSWTPTRAGLFALLWHKNPVGRILILVLLTQNLARISAPLSKLQWWGMLSLWTAVALPFSRLKVLKQFTKLKIWSKQETI